MNAEALLRAIVEYGADENGIRDRFGDNVELYLRCVTDFLDSPNWPELESALRERDYDRAFDAAHSLKGLSGNLGLSGCYDAVCVLVESLRAKSYGGLEGELYAVEWELENLRLLCAGRPPRTKAAPAEKDAAPVSEKRGRAPSLKRRFFFGAALAVLAVFLISLVSFYFIGSNFRQRTRLESGRHLLETGSQIGMYLDSQMAADWKIVNSVGKSVVHGNYADDGEAYAAMLREQREAWGVTDLILYAASGDCVTASGHTETNGVASETIAQAREHGSAFTIVESKLLYTLPIETEQTLRGSALTAVSVVRAMDSFLDEMDFTSFEDNAWMYLTDNSGVVISMLTSSHTAYSYNINSLLDKNDITPLGGTDGPRELFAEAASAFYMTDGEEDRYLVSVPISSDLVEGIQLCLFYMVPAETVNDASNDFSRRLTVFSVAVILVLVCLTSGAFFFMYGSRKRSFDAQLSSREHMFDLLIQNTRSVFALFDTDRSEPAFISRNAPAVLGDSYWAIDRTPSGYRFRSASGRETAMLRQANERLSAWDGSGEFKSGYLRDDTTFPFSYYEIVLYPVGDSGCNMVGILQDMTSVHDREEATKSAMEMAKRSDEAKTRFLANMSHDIRTPMNAIMNMSRFALESASEPKRQEEYLNTIYESSEQLLHLINDVLDMSRIESGQMVVADAPFNIRDTMQSLVETIRPLCAARRQTLLVELDALRSEAVRGDALKVTQIVTNLLSNAVKFTPEGGAVRFTAEELPSLRDDMVSLRFTVEDNGIGIAWDYKAHIFEPFSRADDRRVGRIEGTGLGLSIVKSYVDAMGGTISCDSEEGEGTVFTVELFFQRASMEKCRPVSVDMRSDVPFLGMRCLVVEDVETNRVIAKALLERMGFMVDLAVDGADGVSSFLRSKPRTYALIYMDIQMPLMDGYQATAKIRQSEPPQARTVPIIAMTANVFAEDIEKARIAGMDGFVGKPIVSLELMEQSIKALEKG